MRGSSTPTPSGGSPDRAERRGRVTPIEAVADRAAQARPRRSSTGRAAASCRRPARGCRLNTNGPDTASGQRSGSGSRIAVEQRQSAPIHVPARSTDRGAHVDGPAGRPASTRRPGLVGPLRVQAVAAPAGRRIVEPAIEMVLAEEPVRPIAHVSPRSCRGPHARLRDTRPRSSPLRSAADRTAPHRRRGSRTRWSRSGRSGRPPPAGR